VAGIPFRAALLLPSIVTLLALAVCAPAPAQASAVQSQSPAPPSASFVSPPDEPPSAPALGLSRNVAVRPPAESELTINGLFSYGNYRPLGSAENCKLYYGAIEYDRHSWGRFLGARMDYVAELLPVLILIQPTKLDIYGDTLSRSRSIVPGVGFSPIGFRLLWFDHKAVRPFVIGKLGAVAFSQKAFSQKATYENFSMQGGFGLQIKMTQRTDLRLGLFNFFHISNAFITPVDPGLDVMSSTFGVTYHLGGKPAQ